MADNVAVTAGAGTTIAADEVVDGTLGTVKVQFVKMMDGTLDGTTKLAVVAEDAAFAGGEGGLIPMAKRSDSPAATSGTDGDFEPLQVAGGKLWVAGAYKEDVASGDGDPIMVVGAKRLATPANSSGTDGDYEPLQMNAGALWTAPLGFFATVSTDVTRPADTTAYAVNDAWSDSTTAPTSGGFTFTSAARKSGGSGIITDAVFTTSNDAGTLLQGELWIFNTSVTNINDNTAFAVNDGEIKTCVGKIPFTMEDAGNNGFYHAQNLSIGFTASGSANLRFLIRVKNAYTPASAEVLTCVLKITQID